MFILCFCVLVRQNEIGDWDLGGIIEIDIKMDTKYTVNTVNW